MEKLAAMSSALCNGRISSENCTFVSESTNIEDRNSYFRCKTAVQTCQ